MRVFACGGGGVCECVLLFVCVDVGGGRGLFFYNLSRGQSHPICQFEYLAFLSKTRNEGTSHDQMVSIYV